MKKLKVLTWHIHGSYLYYLTQTDCIFYLPIKNNDEEGYGGKAGSFKWGSNVINVPAKEVKNLDLDLDCIIFQSKKNYLADQFEILSEEQRSLPKIYIEHDPPREHPTDTKHLVNDQNVLLIHVTHFNDLMWDSNQTPTQVIDHGVLVPRNVEYKGDLNKGIVVVNNIKKRGRRLGLDIFEKVRQVIPLDIVGLGSEEVGGLGPLPLDELPEFISRYRFFFNPIRYTSLGLAVCEAMSLGMPIVGLSTTELSTVIKNGENGFIETDLEKLTDKMQLLLNNKTLAEYLSKNAKRYAQDRFNIERFKQDWLETIEQVVTMQSSRDSRERRFNQPVVTTL